VRRGRVVVLEGHSVDLPNTEEGVGSEGPEEALERVASQRESEQESDRVRSGQSQGKSLGL